MTGCWVTWPADIAIRQDIVDIEPYLDQGAAALLEHRDVADAYYEYDACSASVSFALLVRHGITEVIAKRQAADALHHSLPCAGFATSRSCPMIPPIAWLRFTWWPSAFSWW